MAELLQAAIKVDGMGQGDLVRFLQNVRDVVNEIQADAATSKTAVDELNTLTDELRADLATTVSELTAIGTTLANYKSLYDAHTHLADGNAATVSLPDTSSPTGSPGSASAFTDTSGSPPAALSAAAAAAGPAALTNSTALKLTAG